MGVSQCCSGIQCKPCIGNSTQAPKPRDVEVDMDVGVDDESGAASFSDSDGSQDCKAAVASHISTRYQIGLLTFLFLVG